MPVRFRPIMQPLPQFVAEPPLESKPKKRKSFVPFKSSVIGEQVGLPPLSATLPLCTAEFITPLELNPIRYKVVTGTVPHA